VQQWNWEVAEMDTRTVRKDGRHFSLATLALAGLCHHCAICPYSAKRPDSAFEKAMRWHRTWCPAWKAHTKVYGQKALGCCS
jgi:hypothetical protein